MKIKNVVIIAAVILTLFLGFNIANEIMNNNRLVDARTATLSNIKSAEYIANLRGFSGRIDGLIHENASISEIKSEYDSYKDALKSFEMSVSQIETGESKRTEKEIQEESKALQETLLNARRFSDLVNAYFADKKLKESVNNVQQDLFKSATLSLHLENTHTEILRNESTRIIAANYQKTIAFNIITIFVFLGIVFFLNLVIVKPILRLTGVIQRISMGEFNVEMKCKEKKDEIGDLARAFDRTIVSLKLAMKKAKAPPKRKMVK